jgi:hypothetical protein
VAVSSAPTGSDPSTALIAELRQQNAHLPSACQALATDRGFSRQPARTAGVTFHGRTTNRRWFDSERWHDALDGRVVYGRLS